VSVFVHIERVAYAVYQRNEIMYSLVKILEFLLFSLLSYSIEYAMDLSVSHFSVCHVSATFPFVPTLLAFTL
jgi:hypothetical protein